MPDTLRSLCDPLLFHAELPLSECFYPLGFPLRVETDHPAVLRAARDSWGAFPKLFEADALEVRFFVEQGQNDALPPPPVFRGNRNLISIVSDAGNFVLCDYTRRFAFGWLNSAVVGNSAWFRWYFLDAVVYMLLAQLYATPIHAACVARNGRGVLLCGASGVGKSTLAYACARRGWTFIGDDSAMLPRTGEGRRVIGRPYSMRFRDTASGLLPELNGRLAARRVNGKLTIEIPSAELAIESALECTAGALVFLDRREACDATVVPVARGNALGRLAADLAEYDAPVMEEWARSLEQLARVPAFELRYSELQGAVSRLEDIVSGL